MRDKKVVVIILVTVLLALSWAAGVVAAPPPIPSGFYGTVQVGGANVPAGTVISARIGGVEYAEAQTSFYGGDSVYSITVPGDDPLTPEKEGGTEGETVVFHIGVLVADQTGTWHSGSNEELNLTASTPTPTSITIVKETDPDGGTGFDFGGDLGNFSLDDDDSEVFTGLSAGDYDVTEAVPAGWDLDSVVCTGGDSDPLSNGVTVHLDPGEAIICTFTNVQRGSITIVKETNPDGGTGFNFSGDLGPFSLDDDEDEVFTGLSAGDYDVTEAVPAGWDLDSVVCAGGDSTPITDGVRVHLDPGEGITCTFTNEEGGGPPPLPSSFYGTVKVDGANVPVGTVISAWIGGVRYAEAQTSLYGGDSVYNITVPGDDPLTPEKEGGTEGETVVFHIGVLVADQTGTWHSGSNEELNLTASTPTPTSITIVKETDPDGGTGFDFSGDLGNFSLDDDDDEVFSGLSAGDYDVTEAVPSGWDLDSVVCSGGDSDPVSNGVRVHLDSGEQIVCTFTNVQQPGSITIVKETDPDGGTGFDFSGDLGNFSLDDDDDEVFTGLSAGDYDVTEAVPSGWDLDSVVCTGGDSDPISNGVRVHLDPDEAIICTFTNVQQPGSITIVKETDPGGGTDFDFSGDLGNFSLDDGEDEVFTGLLAGDYDVTEAVPAGWDLDSVVCTGGDSILIADGVRVHLDPGEEIICTFTNEEEGGPPPLPSSFYGTVKVDGVNVPIETVISAWIGGVRYAETQTSLYGGDSVYNITVPGDDPLTPEKEGGAEGDTIDFHIGVLVADQTGTWHSGSNEELNLTASTPTPTSITIVKETDPDGGTGFDFSGGLGNFSLDDDEDEVFTGLSAGDYDVTEAVPAGWDLDSVVCSGGDSDSISNGVRVHLDPGEQIVCTFTNVRCGSITIVKETNPNGGTDFDFSGDLGNFSLDDDDSQVFDNLIPDHYDVTEAVPSGWDLDSVVCTGGGSNLISNGVRVHLDPGEAIICTFTNVRRGSITIVKETDPGGGTGFDFSGDLGTFSLDDGADEVFSNLIPDHYDVTEAVPSGWDLDGVVCTGGGSNSISNGVRVYLDPGEQIVCTFTNVQRGSITIVKETDPGGGTGFDFSGDLGTFSLDDGADEVFSNLLPGHYDVTEAVPGGWDLDSVVCIGGGSNSISNGVRVHLDSGEAIICTFTNVQQPGSISIVKETDPDGGTGFDFTGDLGNFSLDDDEDEMFTGLSAGDYDVTEAVPAGWDLDSVVCTGGDSDPISNGVRVHLDPDGAIICTFTNVQQRGSITVVKTVNRALIYAGDTVTYTYWITNNGDMTLTGVTLTDDKLGAVDLTPSRVISDLLALYTFEEGDGTTVHDVSGVGAPLDLTVEDETAVGWIPGGGLSINSSTIVASVVTATKIIKTCKDSDEISIEAWIKPANTTQGGPARIVTLSGGAYDRNFTLGQQASAYNTRLRTTETSGNGIPSLTAGAVTTGEASHVVYTRDASGVAWLYVNGVEVGSRDDIGGDFSNWDEGFRFGLAGEFGTARVWLGELHLVAIYSRALSQADVSQNFEAGAGIVLSPGESITVTVSTTLHEDTTNTATVTGTDTLGGAVSYTDTATVDVINPDIVIEKTANPSTIYTGDTVTYTYEVTNPGDDALSAVTVSDDKCSPVTFVGGDMDGDELLDVGETWTYRCSTTLDEDTTNTATATGTDSAGGSVSDTDMATVDVINPDIAIEKTANPATIYTGDTVTYTYEVTNPGDDALSAVTVSDDKCSPVTFVGGDTDGDELLDVGETWTYRCSTTLDEDTTNTATTTGTDSAGGTVSAQDTAFVAVISPVLTEYFAYLPFVSHNHVIALDLVMEHSKGHKR